MENRWKQLEYFANVIIVTILFGGCRTGSFTSYGADIGDSMFIYIRELPNDIKETDVHTISVYYNYWDFNYLLSVYKDSIGYCDQFECFDRCPIKKTKNEILITKKSSKSELFREKDLDSIVLRKISKSYIDKRDERMYIRKSHFYNNVIQWNKKHNKYKKNSTR